MGVFAGPEITESGLVLALDAANTKSYPTKNFVSSKIYSVFGASLRSSNYTVQYSDDNSNWTTAFTGVASNNTSCGIQQNTGSGSGYYGLHRYWRYVEGSSIQFHHPRVSRIILTDINGIDYNLVVYTSDNCSDTGTYQVGTVSLDFGGTTWTDLSGNGNTGTLVNGVGYNSGNLGSLVFDGVDDTVNGTITGSIFTGSFTQSAWIYKLNNNQIWQGVFTNSSPATNNTYLMTFGDGTVAAPFNSVGANQVGISASGVFLDIGTHTNRWLYIVMTKTGSTLNIYCYKDGSLLQNSGTITWNGGNFATTNNYQLGRHWAGGSVIPLQGNVSQVSVYNRALTAQEIQQNFIATRSRYSI